MSKNYTFKEYFLRGLWILIWPFFRFSPRLLYGWRNFLLRLFGARIGKKVKIFPSARIRFPWQLTIGNEVVISWDVILYNLGSIKIDDRVIISQGVHLCAGTHDYRSDSFPLIKSHIQIEEAVWIAAEAFIGPDVTIGKKGVIGARTVVTKSTEAYGVYGGNPAKLIKKRES